MSQACDAALTLLSAIADKGLTARGRDLVGAGILDDLRSTLPPSVLPDISPTRGEITPAATASTTADVTALGYRAERLISPLVGEMSGRTEGGAKEHNAPSIQPGNPIPLADTRHALPVALPFGSSDAATLIALLEGARRQGVKELRLAPGRQVLFLCETPDTAAILRDQATTLGFITSPADPRAHINACPGAPACASAYLPARAIAMQAAEMLGDRLGENFTLHVSGCAKGCARQEIASLTIVGDEKGAGCVVGGTAKDRPLAYTLWEGAVEGLARVAALVSQDAGADAGKLAGAFERR